MTRTARVFRLGAATVAAVVLSACATLNVSSYVERGADFSRYHTYAWEPFTSFPTGDARLDNNVFFQDHLQGAVARGLESHGFMLSTGGTPDLLIHYHASITQQVDVNGADQKRGYNVSTSGYDMGARPYVFDAGTVTIDLVDAHTKTLVWRGWVERSLDGAINDQAWLERRIDDTVARILERLPNRL